MIKILVIYTGGTIGMVHDTATGALKPFDFEQITAQVPELGRFDYTLNAISLSPLIDSSNVTPAFWKKLASIIDTHYTQYDGFVILHGTDTMAYTASALSFMLNNLSKPVILTGSQLPIGEVRTDAKENFITAVEIAAHQVNGKATVPEVAIFFDYKLLRGNRSSKRSSSKFEAFQSLNYPPLAEAGVHINFNHNHILPHPKHDFYIHTEMSEKVGLLKLYPGMPYSYIQSILTNTELEGIVLESFGSGNTPTDSHFLTLLKLTSKRGVLLYNVTQCGSGAVEQGRYETSAALADMGIISGSDLTSEAALTKLMYILSLPVSKEEKILQLSQSIRGELSLSSV